MTGPLQLRLYLYLPLYLLRSQLKGAGGYSGAVGSKSNHHAPGCLGTSLLLSLLLRGPGPLAQGLRLVRISHLTEVLVPHATLYKPRRTCNTCPFAKLYQIRGHYQMYRISNFEISLLERLRIGNQQRQANNLHTESWDAV